MTNFVYAQTVLAHLVPVNDDYRAWLDAVAAGAFNLALAQVQQKFRRRD